MKAALSIGAVFVAAAIAGGCGGEGDSETRTVEHTEVQVVDGSGAKGASIPPRSTRATRMAW